jgi:hypothetical protein
VGTNREKIRFEGRGFRSGTQVVAAKTQECARERESWQKMELPLTELEQPTLDDHTSLVFIPPG